ncbi:MAG: hypothetical protein U1E56_14210 [Bauldia sp.]
MRMFRGGWLLAVLVACGGAAEAATIKETLAPGKKLVCGYDEFEIQPTGAMRITDALDEDVEFVSIPSDIVWSEDRAEFHLKSLGKVYTIAVKNGVLTFQEKNEPCHF